MSSSGPVEVHVDFAKLDNVASELHRLIGQVGDLGQQVFADPDPGDLGGHEVTDAIAQFYSRWAKGLDSIAQNVNGCKTYVQIAYEGYENVEWTVTDATHVTIENPKKVI